ncbi:carboxymuconolactone decarboxylase family protein [Kiritimatiellaeota bacterium B1221]|nr:carboxymuconolactone decarboxylase family protein [Kiritimatiellaeota bacterium B1221]
MSTFKIHNVENAPEGSRPILEKSLKEQGMIPNLFGVMAEAPELLKGYQALHALALESSFSDEEVTVVWQTFNVEHDCHYCVPAHTAIANMMKVDPAITKALRNRETMPTEKLQVLHETALMMSKKRGNLSKLDVEKFIAAGYENRQLLELVLILAQKIMSNYTNHLAETPLDAPFQPFVWEK